MFQIKKILQWLVTFLVLFPVDRVFSLHVLFIGWAIIYFFPVKNWWQLSFLLMGSLLHDIAYLLPMGFTGIVLSISWFLLLQLKFNRKVVIGFGVFVLSSIFAYIDVGDFQFGTMTGVQAISAVVISYFIFKYKVYGYLNQH